MELMAGKNTSIQRVAKIISHDDEITASLLELAGSTFFDGAEQVDSLVQAVGLLGVETVEGLVLSTEIYRQFGAEEITALTGVPLQDHNMAVSIFSKEIARMEKADREVQGKAFMAGMLHDTGKLLLAANFPDRYQKVIAATAAGNLSVVDGEHRVYGVSHAEVGAYLLSLWGFPDFMIEALAFHHQPGCIPCRGFSLPAAVHVADFLAYAAGSDPTRGVETPQVDLVQLNKLGLADRFEDWKKHCLGLLESAAG
jgi:HD-like signal output (HDOD) protein